MDLELLGYLEKASPRENHEFLNGRKQNIKDYQRLDSSIQKVLPDWIKIMLIEYKIANLLIEFRSIENERLSIRFNSFQAIERACTDSYPGCLILEYGYIGIGEDPTGSGDPYFIKLGEGINPPLYKVYHDVSDIGEVIIKEATKLIANRFSDVFRLQRK